MAKDTPPQKPLRSEDKISGVNYDDKLLDNLGKGGKGDGSKEAKGLAALRDEERKKGGKGGKK